MKRTLFGAAILAAMAVGTSGAALAQTCPPGYMMQNGMCYAAPATGAYAPNNPVSGAAAGAASGAAAGSAAAGPIGGIVGGAIGTATGTLAGTTNMLTGAPVATTGSSMPPAAPAPVCGPGLVFYAGGCYPAR
jgi:hypothetical protein